MTHHVYISGGVAFTRDFKWPHKKSLKVLDQGQMSLTGAWITFLLVIFTPFFILFIFSGRRWELLLKITNRKKDPSIFWIKTFCTVPQLFVAILEFFLFIKKSFIAAKKPKFSLQVLNFSIRCLFLNYILNVRNIWKESFCIDVTYLLNGIDCIKTFMFGSE